MLCLYFCKTFLSHFRSTSNSQLIFFDTVIRIPIILQQKSSYSMFLGQKHKKQTITHQILKYDINQNQFWQTCFIVSSLRLSEFVSAISESAAASWSRKRFAKRLASRSNCSISKVIVVTFDVNTWRDEKVFVCAAPFFFCRRWKYPLTKYECK